MRTARLRRALRTTLALAAVATVSAVAGAQPPAGGPGGGAGRGNMQQMLFEGITLTDAQKKSIDSVQTAFREKAQAGAGEDRRALMQQQRDAVRGLLTDDQKKVYDANMEKMRANMRRPGGR